MSFVEVKNCRKTYGSKENLTLANDDITFNIEKGELCIIVGPSGSGKSTLLNMLGGMDVPDSGKIIVDKKEISSYDEIELTSYRRNDIGFVFQNYNLIPNLTAIENVELSSQIVENSKDVKETLTSVGLGHRLDNFPAQLSGGEQQRVAIARALAKNPKLLLADEPTGALDYQTGKQVLKLLQNQSRKEGTTVIIITHNSLITPIADRVIHLSDSKIKDIDVNQKPQDIENIEW